MRDEFHFSEVHGSDPLCSYLHEPQKNEIYFLNVYKDILGTQMQIARSGQNSNTFEIVCLFWLRRPCQIEGTILATCNSL